MISPDTPDAAAQQALDAQEALEWRDLQNAQIDSMNHVWDNPEDDVWNDVPTTSGNPGNTSTYIEPYAYLTDAQHDLYDRMSEISEDSHCAGWMYDNEYDIWRAIVQGNTSPGHIELNSRLLRRCQMLSTEIGGWIYWADGPQFTPMAQWLEMFANWTNDPGSH